MGLLKYLCICAMFSLAACDALKIFSLDEANGASVCSIASGGDGPKQNHLVISELSYTEYSNGQVWVEVYNGTDAALNLGDYSLFSSTAVNFDGGSATFDYSGRTFQIPDLKLAPKAYAVLKADVYGDEISSGHTLYLRDEQGYYPAWYEFGDEAVELLKDGESVDFVPLNGDEYVLPGNWSGTVPDLGDTPDTSYTLTRDLNIIDSDTIDDWQFTNLSTQLLPNEIACAQDNDYDGIPDCAEEPGVIYSGMKLYDWGARTGRRDHFVEVDYLDFHSDECDDCSAASALGPREQSLDSVRDALEEFGIYVHFDVGDLFDKDGTTGNNLERHDGCGGEKIPFAYGVDLSPSEGVLGHSDLQEIYMDPNRKLVFNYMIYAYGCSEDGGCDAAGKAWVGAGGLMVWAATQATNTKDYINDWGGFGFRAGTILHELGHNFGLWHGGGESLNYKPSYYSVMNYGYSSLDHDGRDDLTFYSQFSFNYDCYDMYVTPFYDSGGTVNDKITFSLGLGESIDENDINEAGGLGYSNRSIDFNCDGTINSGNYSLDINNDGSLQVLNDFDDWSAIRLPLADSAPPPSSPVHPYQVNPQAVAKTTPVQEKTNYLKPKWLYPPEPPAVALD